MDTYNPLALELTMDRNQWSFGVLKVERWEERMMKIVTLITYKKKWETFHFVDDPNSTFADANEDDGKESNLNVVFFEKIWGKFDKNGKFC